MASTSTLVTASCLAIGILVTLYLVTHGSSSSRLAGNSERLSDVSLASYASSVAVIYDFATITPDMLVKDVESLLSWNLNQNLILELILTQNHCENAETQKKAIQLAHTKDRVKLVIIDSSEQVSAGRARAEAIKQTTAPILLFLQSGHMPASDHFLEQMLYDLRKTPSAAVTPLYQTSSDRVPHLTIDLDVKLARISSHSQDQQPLLPLLDDQVFIIRTDLYKAVGGYDQFFFKNDQASMIALSLSLWLCGGSILRSHHAMVSGTPPAVPDGSSKAIQYLQYAKYLQAVFMPRMGAHVRYPGLEFYVTPSFDIKAIRARKHDLLDRSCLPIQWYAKKFSAHLSAVKEEGEYYNPQYKPVLPAYKSYSPSIGRWFILFAGQCVHVADDGVLSMAWCPESFTEDKHRFLWTEPGQLKSGDMCIGLDSGVLKRLNCVEGADNQRFTYNKSTKQIISGTDKTQCVTHVNGDQGRQVLGLMGCEGNSPFNLFIFNDEY